MSYKIKYTDTAKNDLRRIALDILEISKDRLTTINYIDEIQRKTDLVKEFPNIGIFPKDRVLISRGYRFIIYKKYLIFYLIDDQNETIYIKAVINSSRDYITALRNI